MNQIITRELTQVFLATLAIVFFSNCMSVFYFSEYLGDDELRYTAAKLGIFKDSGRTVLGSYVEWPMWKMLATFPKSTHLFYILLYMVPLSFLSYYLYYRWFRIEKSISFLAAVLPNTIPSLYSLPAYTNGSYIIYSLLIGIIGLLFGLSFIEQNTNGFIRFD